MQHKNWFALFASLAILLGNALPAPSAAPVAQAAPEPHPSTPSIPAADLVKPDGTLNTTTGKAGAVDLRGWDARLDPQRGPVLAPQAPAASGVSALGNGVGGASTYRSVFALAVSGTDVYVGGGFTQICGNTACNSGNLTMNGIARWNGSSWSPLGYGVGGTDNYSAVFALAVSGSDVYAAGLFTYVCGNAACNSGNVPMNGIARWNGSSWSPLGYGVNGVGALAVSGSDVYVGGEFRQVCGDPTCTVGNVTVNYIARWNGSSWAALGNGVNWTVVALAVSGGDLYVGGRFFEVCGNLDCISGGTSVNNIAKWNGSSWLALGDGVGAVVPHSEVFALAVSGGDLYAGGYFDYVCGNAACNSGNVTVNNIAKWNGSSWSALGNGVNSTVSALAVSGTDVYVGGGFTQICGDPSCLAGNVNVNNIARWNGSIWAALGNGVGGAVPGATFPVGVLTLAVSGVDVYVGGVFHQICGDSGCGSGQTVNNIVTFKTWSASGLGNGVVNNVLALAVSGGDVYVGGVFTNVCGDPSCTNGNVKVNHLARWSGSNWSALGNGVNDVVYALAVSGSDVYVGGYLTQVCGNLDCNSGNLTVNHVARWNGPTASWSALGYGVNGFVFALAVSGGNVYAGGSFNQVCGNAACNSGNVTVNRIARWNGSSWSALGYGVDNGVSALAVSGSDVYVGGLFTQVCGNAACNSGNATVNHIARWNGSSWSALGNGVNYPVNALAVSGSNVYAGGYFTQVCGNAICNSGNVTANYIAWWNGSSWSALGYGVNGAVNALAVSGGDVYAGGVFTQVCGDPSCFAGNLTANRLAKVNGSTNGWSTLAYGVDNYVWALGLNGSDVYAGGNFVQVCGDAPCSSGNVTVNHVAKWTPAEALWHFNLVYLPLILR